MHLTMKTSNVISVTIHPAKSEGSYLTATDALNQILDLIKVFDLIESDMSEVRGIAWKLADVHFNSPPFTCELEPQIDELSLPEDISSRIALIADRFHEEWYNLTSDDPKPLAARPMMRPLDRVLQRNLNGISETEIKISEEPIIIDNVVAENARKSLKYISTRPFPREFGLIQGTIHSLTKWRNNKPALEIIDRVSGAKVKCVLNNIASEEIGKEHNWHEVWAGRHVDVNGTFYYTRSGNLSRVEVDSIEATNWTSLHVGDLEEINIAQGRSVADDVGFLQQETNE